MFKSGSLTSHKILQNHNEVRNTFDIGSTSAVSIFFQVGEVIAYSVIKLLFSVSNLLFCWFLLVFNVCGPYAAAAACCISVLLVHVDLNGF